MRATPNGIAAMAEWRVRLAVGQRDVPFCNAVLAKEPEELSWQEREFREWLKFVPRFRFEKPSGAKKTSGARSVIEALGRDPTAVRILQTDFSVKDPLFKLSLDPLE